MEKLVARPSNKLRIRVQNIKTAFFAEKEIESVEQSGETFPYTFKGKCNTSTQKRKNKIAKRIFKNIKKDLKKNDYRTSIEQIANQLTEKSYVKDNCIDIPLLKEKIKFNKLEKGSLGDKVYVVMKTENMTSKRIEFNVNQAEEDCLETKNSPITIQQNDKKTVLAETWVGKFAGANEKKVLNAKDYEDYAITEITLFPKDEKAQKKYNSKLLETDDKSTKLFIVVNAEPDGENWKEVYYDEVYDGIPNTWYYGENSWFTLNGVQWHEPVENPERALYNSEGNLSERSGAFGGVRIDTDGNVKNHGGVDIFAPIGTTIYASMTGKVVRARDKGGYGKNIIIRVKKELLALWKNDYQLEFTDPFGNGKGGELEKGPVFDDNHPYRYLLYAHLDTMLVKKGDIITVGKEIGTGGKTGNAKKTDVKNRHLHFEILCSTSTDGYYELTNRENPAFYVNFVEADDDRQKNNTDEQ